MKPRIVFFDIEARKRVKELRPDDEDAGWDDLRHGKGGASAIAVYDTRDKFLYLYDDHCAEACARHLEAADLVVGFTSERFDVPCLEGLIGRRMRLSAHYDILIEIQNYHAKRGQVTQKGDLTLERLARRNLGRGKIDKGSNAATLAKRGQWGKLFNYCADDVHLTRDLFAIICRDGGLHSLGGKFALLPPVPARWREGMEGIL